MYHQSLQELRLPDGTYPRFQIMNFPGRIPITPHSFRQNPWRASTTPHNQIPVNPRYWIYFLLPHPHHLMDAIVPGRFRPHLGPLVNLTSPVSGASVFPVCPKRNVIRIVASSSCVSASRVLTSDSLGSAVSEKPETLNNIATFDDPT